MTRFASRISVFAFGLGLLALGGCHPFSPDLGNAPFACAMTPPLCPSGYTCVSGACTLHGQPRDDAAIFYDTGMYKPDLGACPDADLEPNDTPMTATPLLHQDATLKNLAICPAGDTDYYGIFLHAGQTMTLDLFENPVVGEIDLFVTDGKSNLASATGANTDQHVNFTPSADGTYYVEAAGATPFVVNDYSLQIALTGLGGDAS